MKPSKWIARFLVFSMLYLCCGGPIAAEMAHEEHLRRESIREFAVNLGIDPEELLDPETPDERAQRIAERRTAALERLRTQICTVATGGEIAAIHTEFSRVKGEYLAQRVAGMVTAIKDLEHRLERAQARAQRGKESGISNADLSVYAEALTRGQEDLSEYASLTPKRLRDAGMPKEIVQRTTRFHGVLSREVVALRDVLQAETRGIRRGKPEMIGSDRVGGLKSHVSACVARVRNALEDGTTPESPAHPAADDAGDAGDRSGFLPLPEAGGSGTGDGGGSGGSGGDDGQSGMRASIRRIFDNAGGKVEARQSGTGGDPVDLGTGECFYSEFDLSVPTAGDVAGVVRRYRSFHSADGPFGYGWFHNYSMYLTEDANGNVTLHNDDGRAFLFQKIGEGQYDFPEELDATLSLDGPDYVMLFGKTWSYRFDASGVLLSRSDQLGNSLVMVYDGFGNLDRVENGAATVLLDFESNPEGHVTSIADPGGRTYGYEYDPEGNLSKALDPDGLATTFTYYENHRLSSVTDPDGNTTMYFYDPLGRVHRVVDAEGNDETFSYDFGSGTTIVTDGNGYDRSVTHDTDGRVTETVDARGNRTGRTLDDKGRVTSDTDEFGNTTTYEYGDCDACGVSRMVDPGGTVTVRTFGPYGVETTTTTGTNGDVRSATNVYDTSGKLVQQILPDSEVVTYEYNASGQLIRRKSSSGMDSEYTYDEAGRRTGEIRHLEDADQNPVPVERGITFDDSGLPTGVLHGNGRTTQITTNGRGLPVRIELADSSVGEIAYTGSGVVESVTNADGLTTKFDFDSGRRNTSVVEPGDRRRETHYDPAGNLVKSIDPEGNETLYEFNEINQRVRMTDARGYTTDMLYCGDGRSPNGVVLPTGESFLVDYDWRDRPVRFTDDVGNTVTREYTSVSSPNSPTFVRDAMGNEARFEYDELGRLVLVVDALGNTIKYEYGPFSNDPTRIIDAEGRTRTFEYDAAGNVIRDTNGLGQTTRYYHDGDGNIVRMVDADGGETTYTYNSRNQLLTAAFPDGSTVEHTYQGGLRTGAANGNSVIGYEYDEAARVTRMTNETLNKSLTYAYNQNNQPRTIGDSDGGTTAFAYDELGNVSSIEYPDGTRVRYEYDEAGRRTGVHYPNDTRLSVEYDSLGRIASEIVYSPDDTLLIGRTYTYDKVGDILTSRDHTGTVMSYTYDDLYRVTQVREDGILLESFTHDKVGNILSHRLQGQTTNYDYNAANQLVAAGVAGVTTTYEYDGSGRLERKLAPEGTTTYAYTADSRLGRVDLPGGQSVSYEYDATGRKIARTDSLGRTDYLLDNDHTYADYSGGTMTDRYLRGTETDEMIGILPQSGEPVYLHQDRLQSVRASTGPYGDLLGTRDYSAFGAITNDTGVAGRFGYTGRDLDSATGLSHYRSRWYSADLARFITPDSQMGELEFPLSLHRYAYVHDNPVNFNDPYGFGLFSEIVGVYAGWYGITISVVSAMLACYSPIAAVIVGLFDVLIAFLASLCDLLGTYDTVPGNTCAFILLMILAYIAKIFIIISANSWSSCVNEIWEKFAATLLVEAFKKAVDTFVKIVGGPIERTIFGLLVRVLLAYLQLIQGWSIGVTIFKFFMAPELLLAFCVAVTWTD